MDLNTGQPAQLNAVQMDAILISYVVQSIQIFSQVHGTKHKDQTLEIQTSKGSVFKCFWNSNGGYSDPHCIYM